MKTRAAFVIAVLFACASTASAASKAAARANNPKPAPAAKSAPTAEERDLMKVLTESGDLTTFVGMLKTADMVKTLSAPPSRTIFAPSDGAFSKIPKSEVDSLVADRARLVHFINGLVYGSKVRTVDTMLLKDVKMANGDMRTFSVRDYRVHIDSAKVVKENMPYANGMVQEIDVVLIAKSNPPEPPKPPKAVEAPKPAAAPAAKDGAKGAAGKAASGKPAAGKAAGAKDGEQKPPAAKPAGGFKMPEMPD